MLSEPDYPPCAPYGVLDACAVNHDISTPVANLPAEVRERVFVIIPAYNEADRIAEVAAEVGAQYPNVIVVDDGSTDKTYEAARKGPARVLRHVLNRGQGAAIQTGIDFALAQGAEYIVTFDADGQHRVEDICALLRPIVDGECDITLGSRFLTGNVNMPATRRMLLRWGVLFTRIVSRVKLTDTHNGLRGFSRQAAEKIDITLDRMAHASELIDQIRASGLPFREVPVEVRYTAYSLAKGQSAKGALRILVHYLSGRILP
ncbi:MAG: glycosyltransferase family 2 protein [Planctomycetes bacterium]|nr:glycosyltransferase family 2 protein [Planctomycetota bacterium]